MTLAIFNIRPYHPEMSSLVASLRADARTEGLSFIKWFEEACLKRYGDEIFGIGAPCRTAAPLVVRLSSVFPANPLLAVTDNGAVYYRQLSRIRRCHQQLRACMNSKAPENNLVIVISQRCRRLARAKEMPTMPPLQKRSKAASRPSTTTVSMVR